MRGRISFRGHTIDNLLKQTIFKATHDLGCDWLVSVFADNAGVVRFDDEYDVCFKVETHNHPSAIDPYGGANTGPGRRDPRRTRHRARLASRFATPTFFAWRGPICRSTSFRRARCIPGACSRAWSPGVRDYGNRMGIPTVNGAVAVDPGYLANPLVFCGTVGLLPRGLSAKKVVPGDLIVAVGGRTGRDGIHGATFSSIELSAQSEAVSGGAVQIGNAITEKMMLDVILQARDHGYFHAITDCGAGGFSSAVGEMGAHARRGSGSRACPSQVSRIVLYRNLDIRSTRATWCLPCRPRNGPPFAELCRREDVEATGARPIRPERSARAAL